MAVTINAEQLRSALKIGETQEESAEITRLLAFARSVVERRAGSAPMEVCNEAIIRLAAFYYDRPFWHRGALAESAMRNSGAGEILAPYFQPRAT